MPTRNEYYIGQSVVLSGIVRDSVLAAVDVPTAVFKYMTPASAVVTKSYPADAEVVRVAAGQFYLVVNIPSASAQTDGHWRYRFMGVSGAVTVATENEFYVYQSVFD